MTRIAPEPLRETIEIVDLPEEGTGNPEFNAWLLIPIFLTIAACIFFLISRLLTKDDR